MAPWQKVLTWPFTLKAETWFLHLVLKWCTFKPSYSKIPSNCSGVTEQTQQLVMCCLISKCDLDLEPTRMKHGFCTASWYGAHFGQIICCSRVTDWTNIDLYPLNVKLTLNINSWNLDSECCLDMTHKLLRIFQETQELDLDLGQTTTHKTICLMVPWTKYVR